MSVFSVDPKSGNPVITEVLDEVCKSLGVRIKHEEKEDYRKLLAVFDESARELMAMDGKETNTSAELRTRPYQRCQTTFPKWTSNDFRDNTSDSSRERRTPMALGRGDAVFRTRSPTAASSQERRWR